MQHKRKPLMETRSRFKGVSVACGKWTAAIISRGERHFLGAFSDEVAAALAYDAAAVDLHGEFALLNFPPIQSLEVTK